MRTLHITRKLAWIQAPRRFAVGAVDVPVVAGFAMAISAWSCRASILILVACTDAATTPVDGPPPVMTDPVTLVEVDLSSTHPVSVALVRDSSTVGWRRSATQIDQRYWFEVTGPYTVAFVCGDEHTRALTMRHATPKDGTQHVFCSASTTLALTSQIRGRMVQPGTIELGGTHSSSEPNWAFLATVPAGAVDLIAHDRNKIVVRRGLQSGGTLDIAPIDLDREGVELERRRVDVVGVDDDEDVLTDLYWGTANGSAYIWYDGTILRSVPDALWMPGDQQYVALNAQTQTSARSVYVDPGAEPKPDGVPLALLPRLDDLVTVSDLGASWTALPTETTRIALLLQSFTGETVNVTATASWAVGRNELRWDLEFPGGPARWFPGDVSYRSFEVWDREVRSTRVWKYGG